MGFQEAAEAAGRRLEADGKLQRLRKLEESYLACQLGCLCVKVDLDISQLLLQATKDLYNNHNTTPLDADGRYMARGAAAARTDGGQGP